MKDAVLQFQIKFVQFYPFSFDNSFIADHDKQDGLGGGAIAGIIIAIIVGVCALVGVLYYFLYYRPTYMSIH